MKKVFVSFEEAKEYAQSLGLSSSIEWIAECKIDKPNDIPANPRTVYPDEWEGWGDFLGTGNTRGKNFLPFEEARKRVRSLGLVGYAGWVEYSKNKRPSNIPGNPFLTYKNKGWNGFSDWLGTFLSYEEAKDCVKDLGLKSLSQLINYKKINGLEKMPSQPSMYYKNKGWKGHDDFYGRKKKVLNYVENCLQ